MALDVCSRVCTVGPDPLLPKSYHAVWEDERSSGFPVFSNAIPPSTALNACHTHPRALSAERFQSLSSLGTRDETRVTRAPSDPPLQRKREEKKKNTHVHGAEDEDTDEQEVRQLEQAVVAPPDEV